MNKGGKMIKVKDLETLKELWASSLNAESAFEVLGCQNSCIFILLKEVYCSLRGTEPFRREYTFKEVSKK